MPLLQLNLSGRMGNILFQYAHARAWCEQNGHDLCLLPWVGERIFQGVPEAIRPNGLKPDVIWIDHMFQHQRDLIYTRKQVREWFAFKPEIIDMLRGRILEEALLFDVRKGSDYLSAGLVSLGPRCYIDAAIRFGYDPIEAGWEIDTSPTRLPEFTGDVNAAGFQTTWVSVPAFYRMMKAKVHFRANSSFSWWAATLGNARVFSPVIKGMRGGVPEQYCQDWVEGNHAATVESPDHSDLHLKPE